MSSAIVPVRLLTGIVLLSHTNNLISGNPQHGTFAQYCVAPVATTAILPESISFVSGTVIPLALDAAIAGLSVTVEGEAMPGVPIPTMGLPLPSLDSKPVGKSILVYGGSSAAGLMAIQVAAASGVTVFATASPRNFDLVKSAGAVSVFDYKSDTLVNDIVRAATEQGDEFVGIFDAISIPETFSHDLEVLAKLGGKHLACSHPPPTEGVPEGVKAGMFFCLNAASHPTWADFITPALETGAIKCIPPPKVVGHGLEFIQKALDESKAGVSAAKLVVTL
jgi:NADPH:quinone reductase-like Zn-dependent oxidoreductase